MKADDTNNCTAGNPVGPMNSSSSIRIRLHRNTPRDDGVGGGGRSAGGVSSHLSERSPGVVANDVNRRSPPTSFNGSGNGHHHSSIEEEPPIRLSSNGSSESHHSLSASNRSGASPISDHGSPQQPQPAHRMAMAANTNNDRSGSGGSIKNNLVMRGSHNKSSVVAARSQTIRVVRQSSSDSKQNNRNYQGARLSNDDECYDDICNDDDGDDDNRSTHTFLDGSTNTRNGDFDFGTFGVVSASLAVASVNESMIGSLSEENELQGVESSTSPRGGGAGELPSKKSISFHTPIEQFPPLFQPQNQVAIERQQRASAQSIEHQRAAPESTTTHIRAEVLADRLLNFSKRLTTGSDSVLSAPSTPNSYHQQHQQQVAQAQRMDSTAAIRLDSSASQQRMDSSDSGNVSMTSNPRMNSAVSGGAPPPPPPLGQPHKVPPPPLSSSQSPGVPPPPPRPPNHGSSLSPRPSHLINQSSAANNVSPLLPTANVHKINSPNPKADLVSRQNSLRASLTSQGSSELASSFNSNKFRRSSLEEDLELSFASLYSTSSQPRPVRVSQFKDAAPLEIMCESLESLPPNCDKKGRCAKHPLVRLYKKKLLGGFELVRESCPYCDVEGGTQGAGCSVESGQGTMTMVQQLEQQQLEQQQQYQQPPQQISTKQVKGGDSDAAAATGISTKVKESVGGLTRRLSNGLVTVTEKSETQDASLRANPPPPPPRKRATSVERPRASSIERRSPYMESNRPRIHISKRGTQSENDVVLKDSSSSTPFLEKSSSFLEKGLDKLSLLHNKGRSSSRGRGGGSGTGRLKEATSKSDGGYTLSESSKSSSSNTSQVNKFDKNGRCKKHPSIILARKKPFANGWDMLRDECPFCDECKGSEINKAKMNSLLRKRSGRNAQRSLSNDRGRILGGSGSRSRSRSMSMNVLDDVNDIHASCPVFEVLVSELDEPKSPKKKSSNSKKKERKCESSRKNGGNNTTGDEDRTFESRRATSSSETWQSSDQSRQMSMIDQIPTSQGMEQTSHVSKMPYTTPNGQSGWYTGEVNSNGKPNGHGRMRFKTGSQFEGEWVDGYSEEYLEKQKRMKSGFGTNIAPWKMNLTSTYPTGVSGDFSNSRHLSSSSTGPHPPLPLVQSPEAVHYQNQYQQQAAPVAQYMYHPQSPYQAYTRGMARNPLQQQQQVMAMPPVWPNQQQQQPPQQQWQQGYPPGYYPM